MQLLSKSFSKNRGNNKKSSEAKVLKKWWTYLVILLVIYLSCDGFRIFSSTSNTKYLTLVRLSGRIPYTALGAQPPPPLFLIFSCFYAYSRLS